MRKQSTLNKITYSITKFVYLAFRILLSYKKTLAIILYFIYYNIRIHSGTTPLHRPSASQVKNLFPKSLYPCLQWYFIWFLYSNTWPSLQPSLISTGNPQFKAVIKYITMHKNWHKAFWNIEICLKGMWWPSVYPYRHRSRSSRWG